MIKFGQKSPERQLIDAIKQENHQKFQSLIEDYIDYSFRDSWDQQKTFLHHCQNIEMAKTLVKIGVNPHELDESCVNALFYAKNMDLVQYYLSLKVDYTILSKEKENILFYCRDNYDKAKLFVDLGVNVHQKHSGGENVLHSQNNIKIVKLFLEAGVNANDKSNNGDIALHMAGKYSIIKLLIEYGSDVNCVNGIQLTPLMSIFNLSLQSMKLLIKKGANPHYIVPYSHQNLLHKYYAKEDIVHYLMGLGVDSHLKDTHERTPRDMAQKKGITTFDTYDIHFEKKQLETSLTKITPYKKHKL